MKVERINARDFRVTNDTDHEVAVLHGDDLKERDTLAPGDAWTFAAPLEVRLGPFLPEEGIQVRQIHLPLESAATMRQASGRAWRLMQQRANGRALAFPDFVFGIGEWLKAMAGEPEEAPRAGPRLVADNTASAGEQDADASGDQSEPPDGSA